MEKTRLETKRNNRSNATLEEEAAGDEYSTEHILGLASDSTTRSVHPYSNTGT